MARFPPFRVLSVKLSKKTYKTEREAWRALRKRRGLENAGIIKKRHTPTHWLWTVGAGGTGGRHKGIAK